MVAERLSRGKGKSRVFDHREPVFAAACMFACSKHANVSCCCMGIWGSEGCVVGSCVCYGQLRVDKVKLLDAVCGNPKSFEAIVSSIEVAACFRLLCVR